MKKNYLDFKTVNGNQYVYDANTGCVIACDEIMTECISLLETNSFHEVKQKLSKKHRNTEKVNRAISFIETFSDEFNGFYKTEKMIKDEQKYMTKFDQDEVEICLFRLGMFGQIVLNMTENCK
ncbi:MAG: hypothetical protein IKS48_12065 [Eubacterium sp.]|nr:hypothetical protein [Eubacterium sp.]